MKVEQIDAELGFEKIFNEIVNIKFDMTNN